MILNAANINFVAFNRFGSMKLDGQMFAIFTIILAAAEAAVALAIVLNVFYLFDSIKPSEADLLREWNGDTWAPGRAAMLCARRVATRARAPAPRTSWSQALYCPLAVSLRHPASLRAAACDPARLRAADLPAPGSRTGTSCSRSACSW
jgi:hypothetical protein